MWHGDELVSFQIYRIDDSWVSSYVNSAYQVPRGESEVMIFSPSPSPVTAARNEEIGKASGVAKKQHSISSVNMSKVVFLVIFQGGEEQRASSQRGKQETTQVSRVNKALGKSRLRPPEPDPISSRHHTAVGGTGSPRWLIVKTA